MQVDEIPSKIYKFTKYVRLVLPLDGYVFWVRADLVSKSALMNASAFNTYAFNKAQTIVTPAPFCYLSGSMHYSTDVLQEQEHNYSVNTVVFNADVSGPIDLNQISPNVMFIGEFESIRYAFSRRADFYQQASIYHYVGRAIYSDMETQIVDSLPQLDTKNVIVSNSLPAWLALNNYSPFYGFGNSIPLFPSFLVPTNLEPPYGAVHIQPELTEALASAPTIGRRSSHDQLAADTVKVTLWGTRNFTALTFLDCVLQYSQDYGRIGLMNMPIVRDEKRTQVEIAAIAQKKSIEFRVSYLQSTMRDIARQLITEALVAYYPADLESA